MQIFLKVFDPFNGIPYLISCIYTKLCLLMDVPQTLLMTHFMTRLRILKILWEMEYFSLNLNKSMIYQTYNAFQIYDIVTKFEFENYMLLDPSQIDMLTWKLPNYSDSKSYTHTWNSYSWHYSYCCVPYSFLLLDCSSCYYCNPRGQKPFPIAKIHPFVVGFVVFTINWYVSWARRKFQRQGVQQQFVATLKKKVVSLQIQIMYGYFYCS